MRGKFEQMRKKLNSCHKKLSALGRKNNDGRVFLDKNARQAETEFDCFFVRAQSEVHCKRNQVHRDVSLRLDSETQTLSKSIARMSAVEQSLLDLRAQIQRIQQQLADSSSGPVEEKKSLRIEYELARTKFETIACEKESSLRLVQASQFRVCLKNSIFGFQIGYISMC